MAEKRFYWLKLKEDYFNSPKIKKLRKIAGGDTYTIIYLKMQLLSIKNQGVIQFEGIENTFEEELALKLDEDIDNIKITLNYLIMQSLIEQNDKEYLLIDASNNIGSEGQSAERVRNFREREKALQCNGCVTPMLQTSISISNSISNSNIKHKYGEYQNVSLTDAQIEKLNKDYGEDKVKRAISYLDSYIQEKNYKTKDHNLTLRRWVFKALDERKTGKAFQSRDYSNSNLNELFDNIQDIKT